MLYKAVGLVAHGGLRKANDLLPVFPPCKASQKIYLAVYEHLVKVSEFAVNVFVTPTGVFG